MDIFERKDIVFLFLIMCAYAALSYDIGKRYVHMGWNIAFCLRTIWITSKLKCYWQKVYYSKQIKEITLAILIILWIFGDLVGKYKIEDYHAEIWQQKPYFVDLVSRLGLYQQESNNPNIISLAYIMNLIISNPCYFEFPSKGMNLGGEPE